MEDRMEIIIIVLILVDIGARVAPFLMKKREIKEKDEKALELAKKRAEGFNNLMNYDYDIALKKGDE
jgi:hypothetical protein